MAATAVLTGSSSGVPAQTRSSVLFDTPRFTRALEALYERMYRRYHLGLRPEHLASAGPLEAA